MDMSNHFRDFLSEIRLTPAQRRHCAEQHQLLQQRLKADEDIKDITVGTFLQGSYKRSTAVRPLAADEKADVDVVLVTTIDASDKIHNRPSQVFPRFRAFLDRHYPGKWEPHDRSFAIDVGGQIKLDLVPTAALSQAQAEVLEASAWRDGWTLENPDGRPDTLTEAMEVLRKAAGRADWEMEPLLIPSRDLEEWVPTHPLEQIRWTVEKNGRCNDHYLGVVKAMKWWRKRRADPEYPKGYPLEHVIGIACPDGIGSVAAGLTAALEHVRDSWLTKPHLQDHGVSQDVLKRISEAEWAGFHRLITAAAQTARAAFNATSVLESATLWRQLLGEEFPPPPEGGYSERLAKAGTIPSGRFGDRRS